MEAWPRSAEGRPLAAHVVMAGDFNKGGYTTGKLFNEAVVREGLPLRPLDLTKGTCPITGAASWEMASPPVRFERSTWFPTEGEHEILGIPRPSTGTTNGLLICAPRNGKGQLQGTQVSYSVAFLSYMGREGPGHQNHFHTMQSALPFIGLCKH